MDTFLEKYCTPTLQKFIDFHKEIKEYSKNNYIFKAGETATGLYIIEHGKVKMTSHQYDGGQRLIRLATVGELFGFRGFGGNYQYPISAMALEQTRVSFIPLSVFETIAKTNPDFTYHLMMYMAEELRKSEAKIKHYPVKNLVARALLDNYKAFGFENKTSTKLSFTLSRKDIASKAGTTYETVVRTLAELNKRKVIKIDGKAIHILNMDELRFFARPELARVRS